MYKEEFEFLKDRANRLSKCRHRKVAAMILDATGPGEHIVGLNCEGPIAGPCKESCLRDDLNIESGKDPDACRGFHAEQSAILQAGLDKCAGKVILTTLAPCSSCAKWLIAAGISKVVYQDDYTSGIGLKLLTEAGIEVDQYKEEQ